MEGGNERPVEANLCDVFCVFFFCFGGENEPLGFMTMYEKSISVKLADASATNTYFRARWLSCATKNTKHKNKNMKKDYKKKKQIDEQRTHVRYKASQEKKNKPKQTKCVIEYTSNFTHRKSGYTNHVFATARAR